MGITSPPAPCLDRKHALTPREYEVLALLAQSKSNHDIAMVLDISIHTVKTHVRRLIQKLAVTDRRQVVAKALQTGLVHDARRSVF